MGAGCASPTLTGPTPIVYPGWSKTSNCVTRPKIAPSQAERRPHEPPGPTRSLTSTVATYGYTVTRDDGIGEMLITGAKTDMDEAGGAITGPPGTPQVRAMGLMTSWAGGSKLMPVTEKVLMAPQVGHSCSGKGTVRDAARRRPFSSVQSAGSVNT